MAERAEVTRLTPRPQPLPQQPPQRPPQPLPRQLPEPVPRQPPPQEPLWREVLGHRLRALRQDQRQTLSETAGRAGISPQYLSEVERGRKEPSSEMIAALTGALGITLTELTEQLAGDLRRQHGTVTELHRQRDIVGGLRQRRGVVTDVGSQQGTATDSSWQQRNSRGAGPVMLALAA